MFTFTINKYINREIRKVFFTEKSYKDKRNAGVLEESSYNHHRKNNSGKDYEWMLYLDFDKEWNMYSVFQDSSHITHKLQKSMRIVYNQMIKINIYQ